MQLEMPFKIIQRGDADVMVAGGAEAGITPTAVAGFAACRALSTSYNDNPEKASRPFDKNRDGFVLGEGGRSCRVRIFRISTGSRRRIS